nr:zinc finger, CCHC-type [Tanacetum cinerariifolium]
MSKPTGSQVWTIASIDLCKPLHVVTNHQESFEALIPIEGDQRVVQQKHKTRTQHMNKKEQNGCQPIPSALAADSTTQVLVGWNVVYDAHNEGLRGERKLKQGALYLYVGNGVHAHVEAIGRFDLVLPNSLVICLDNCHYAPTITRGVVLVSCLIDNGFIQCFTDYGIFVSKNNVLYFNAIPRDGKMTRKAFPHHTERTTDLLGIIHTDVCGPLRHVSRQESATRILNMVPTKKVDKTPYELWYKKVPNLTYLTVWGCEALVKKDMPEKLQQRSVKCIIVGYTNETIGYYFYFLPKNKIVVAKYAKFFEKNLISQEVSGRARELKEIQDEDTSPSENTSKIPTEVKGFEPPQEEEAHVCRSVRTHQAHEPLCLNVKIEEHNLGDPNEPSNYKAALLDLKSDKWLDDMNAKMQSMKDNKFWR